MSHIVIDARIISSTTGRYVERLLHHLENIDSTNSYTVLVRKKDEKYWAPTNPNFRINIAEFDSYSFNEQYGLLRVLNSLKADLVHFTMPQQPILYRGKKVTTFHDLTLLKTYNPDKNWLIYKSKQFIGRFVFWQVANSSRAIIVPTDFTKNEVLERYRLSSEKVIRTYEAAELKTTGSDAYPLPSANFILFVGQQSDYKNARGLAAAHQSLLKKYPDLYLVLAGKIDSPAQKNQVYFKKLGYKNIIFTGFVSDDQLNWLYQHTKVYVFPSFMEGFGLMGLEAMLQGAPVASSDATCLPEVYGEAAAYFDPAKPEEIASTIEQIMTDEQLRSRLVASGYEQVKKYSWKRMAEQTLDVYNQALNKN